MVGSHKDAFRAHQMVKKLTWEKNDPALARLAADILLSFVKSHRQVQSDFIVEKLPQDRTRYDHPGLDRALSAVGGLCGQCAEYHNNACFINQVRRILIAAKTRVDLGSDFDGTKTLEMLLDEARQLAGDTELPEQDGLSEEAPCETGPAMNAAAYAELREKYEALKEKDVFRATLISEIVETLRSVSDGNFETEMPVHDDPQLGQLATAFNLMLRAVRDTMNHLDLLVADRTADLHMVNLELMESLEEVEATNKKIMDSISYAKVIQSSLLTNLDRAKTYLPDSFFLWKPRDVVGGDIFYTDAFENGFVLAVVDCTGHGVPGAFMTMIASSGLRRIVGDERCHNPADILKRLNFIVKTSLQQDTDHALSDDGLDAAVCFANTQEQKLCFAGARIPLFYVSDGRTEEIRGDRQSIGYRRSDLNFEFTCHTVPIRPGMAFYMSSDGFTDQLGGERELRFGKKRLKKLLAENSRLPFEQQRQVLLSVFRDYKGNLDMQDDVTVVGFGF